MRERVVVTVVGIEIGGYNLKLHYSTVYVRQETNLICCAAPSATLQRKLVNSGRLPLNQLV